MNPFHRSLMPALSLAALVSCLGGSVARAGSPALAPEAMSWLESAAPRKALEERLEAYKRLERLRKDLRYISEELDRELLDEEEAGKELSVYSRNGHQRLAVMRRRGNIDPKLAPALGRLAALYRGLPAKQYAAAYAPSLLKAVSDSLRWIAEGAQSEQELLSFLEKSLTLPESIGDLAVFPVDIPLSEFRRLDPVRVFLMKHRLSLPPKIAKTTPAAIIAGKHNVQAGVEIEGRVTIVHNCWFDLDVCFNIGDLHIEMPPEWRQLHRGIPLPKEGEHVRLRGWTYFDSFHTSDVDYDPKDLVLGANRATLWEIHPLQDVEILP